MLYQTRAWILLISVSMLMSSLLIADDAALNLSTLPIPQGARVVKTTSPQGTDRTLMFAVQGEASKAKDWISKELKNQGWATSGKKSQSESDIVLNAKKSGLKLNVSFVQSGADVLITYAVTQPASSAAN